MKIIRTAGYIKQAQYIDGRDAPKSTNFFTIEEREGMHERLDASSEDYLVYEYRDQNKDPGAPSRFKKEFMGSFTSYFEAEEAYPEATFDETNGKDPLRDIQPPRHFHQDQMETESMKIIRTAGHIKQAGLLSQIVDGLQKGINDPNATAQLSGLLHSISKMGQNIDPMDLEAVTTLAGMGSQAQDPSMIEAVGLAQQIASTFR